MPDALLAPPRNPVAWALATGVHSRQMARLAHVLAPRERVFFDLFEEGAQNALEAAGLLLRMAEDSLPRHELEREISARERESARIASDVVHRLSETFVTPIDRRDAHRLSTTIDEVADRIDEAAGFLAIQRADDPMGDGRHQAWLLHYPCETIAAHMPRLRGFRSLDTLRATIGELEDTSSRTEREAVARLFDQRLDPIDVVRLKEVHHRLGAAFAAAARVAGVMESIVIKNA